MASSLRCRTRVRYRVVTSLSNLRNRGIPRHNTLTYSSREKRGGAGARPRKKERRRRFTSKGYVTSDCLKVTVFIAQVKRIRKESSGKKSTNHRKKWLYSLSADVFMESELLLIHQWDPRHQHSYLKHEISLLVLPSLLAEKEKAVKSNSPLLVHSYQPSHPNETSPHRCTLRSYQILSARML